MHWQLRRRKKLQMQILATSFPIDLWNLPHDLINRSIQVLHIIWKHICVIKIGGVLLSTLITILSFKLYLWRTESGSFNVTGILIFERSFPMFLHNKFHKLTPAVEDIGTGSLTLLPVRDSELDFDALSPVEEVKN